MIDEEYYEKKTNKLIHDYYVFKSKITDEGVFLKEVDKLDNYRELTPFKIEKRVTNLVAKYDKGLSGLDYFYDEFFRLRERLYLLCVCKNLNKKIISELIAKIQYILVYDKLIGIGNMDTIRGYRDLNTFVALNGPKKILDAKKELQHDVYAVLETYEQKQDELQSHLLENRYEWTPLKHSRNKHFII